MDARLAPLLQHPLLWQTGVVRKVSEAVSTGSAELDERLPNRGWPAQGMVEILSEQPGYSELMLFLPAIHHVIGQGGFVAMIEPPFEPYAPAFSERSLDPDRFIVVRTSRLAWAMEQVTRAAACHIVFAWAPRIQEKSLRRLQLAAEQKQVLLVLSRPMSARTSVSPAALRLTLGHGKSGFEVDIFKSRGGRSGRVVVASSA